MDQSREQRRGAIDRINDVYRLAQTLRTAGVLTGMPWGWIILGAIAAITIFAVIILLAGQGASFETSQDTSQNISQSITSDQFNTYFCQGALKWQSQSCDLGRFGCTPTSMAMIMNSFGTKITPPEVSSQYFNLAGCNRATNFDDYIDRFDSLGFAIGPSLVKFDSLYGGDKLNMKEAESFLKSGYLILVASGPYKCFPSNKCADSLPRDSEGNKLIGLHEFVVTSVDITKNLITIRDPNSCNYGSFEDVENPTHNTRSVIKSNFGNFLHAYPIKKT